MCTKQNRYCEHTLSTIIMFTCCSANEAFPRITPDKLQFFEYDTVYLSCEEFSGRTEWRVMQKLNKENPTISNNYNSSAPNCTIYPAREKHSGAYWCEDAEGKTSSTINISVTGGSVILEVPVRPVVEGHDVTLRCRNKETQSKHIADFYKGGVHLVTTYESKMTIQKVSESDEGLYKCSFSGAGESPESWLAVLKQRNESFKKIHPSHRHSSYRPLLWIVVENQHQVPNHMKIIQSQERTAMVIPNMQRMLLSKSKERIKCQVVTMQLRQTM
uniref:high affinity immunoglobulin gamma Fc receptor I-like n=1 Tax=Semicossyphus pulcher TaxID=241346 RepID=UPI0037E9BE28